MLDIKHIIENAEAYKESSKNRYMPDVMDEVIVLYTRGVELQQKIEALQQERNALAKHKGHSDAESIQRGREIKSAIAEHSADYEKNQTELEDAAKRVPNLHHPDAPVGKEEKNNLVVKTRGTPRTFDFTPKDHLQLGRSLDLFDFDTAARVSGPKFYYFKNQAVFLELALLRFGADFVTQRGFDIFQTPDLAKTSVVGGIGFNPRGNESNIYNIEDEPLSLVGTAEITLGGYYMNSVMDIDALPIRMAGISHCFRKEAGAPGQYSKGLYRVHQFTKLEMFIFCRPEFSEDMHRELLETEEALYQALEIPYRVVDTCTGDLGAPAYRKFDIEAWMPCRAHGEYGEITSASNCADYQSRRLGIRAQVVDESGKKRRVFPHMLNGTAIAVPRVLIAIVENFQNADGSVTIPPALVPYCGFETITPSHKQ